MTQLRQLYPDLEMLDKLGAEARLIVSEPLGDYQGHGTRSRRVRGVVRPGKDEIQPFLPVAARILTMSESDLRARVAELMPRAREELSEIVAIRSVADPRQFPPEECRQAATWVADRFADVGFDDVRLAETPDGSSAVVGSRPCGDRDAPTVLLYAHYDVQPPLDEDAWRTPPFRLTEVDSRW